MKNLKIIILILSIFIFIQNLQAQKINKYKSFGSYVFEQNGKKLSANKLIAALSSNSNAQNIALSSNSNAQNIALSGKSQYKTGNILAGIGGFGIGSSIGSAISVGGFSLIAAAGGTVFAIAGIIMRNKGASKLAEAVDVYNSELSFIDTKEQQNFYVSPAKNGFGLALNF